jgi:adenylate cyclase 9
MDNATDHLFSGHHKLIFELILDILLLFVLIWFLNREFEISYRVSFHGDAGAAKAKQQMKENKEQADWLLHNIIPQHVSEQLRMKSKLNILSLNRPTTACISIQKSIIANKWAYGCLF